MQVRAPRTPVAINPRRRIAVDRASAAVERLSVVDDDGQNVTQSVRVRRSRASRHSNRADVLTDQEGYDHRRACARFATTDRRRADR